MFFAWRFLYMFVYHNKITEMALTEIEKNKFLSFQRNEMTESIVYAKLANVEKNPENKKVLQRIAAEEASHAEILRNYTGMSVKPDSARVHKFYFLARVFGVTFAVKLMERGENSAQENYSAYPELERLVKDEEEHERLLIGMINEERLSYMGSVVLGLNDALVEFTGALAGFTLALNDASLIALTGSITGIAAALSMASSEYLSTKSEGGTDKHPVKASVYTGVAYLITVSLLVSPFIMFANVLLSLGVMLLFALLIIAIFNYYYSVAKDESFKKRFLEMAALSFGVAGVSFLIGYLLKVLTGIDA